MTTMTPRGRWDILLPALTVIACADEFALLALPGLWHGRTRAALLVLLVACSLVVFIGTPVCERRGLLRHHDEGGD